MIKHFFSPQMCHKKIENRLTNKNVMSKNVDNGYPHDGCAYKNPYPQDRCADKDSYSHDSNN